MTDNYDSEAFLDALDEVHTRFILNLPPEELASTARLFFQLEQAWWFYEDMIRDECADEELLVQLPHFANMKAFAKVLFAFSPLFVDMQGQFPEMWKEFSEYKRKISTYGTILLNEAGNQIVLCQMYNSDTWTFPAGKINQGERGIEAAARETYEETGFDPHCLSGLTKQWKEQQADKVTWPVPLDEEKNALSFVENNGKRRTCYICPNVPMDFDFAPVCRKEVDNINWFNLNELPKKSFAVNPFVKNLRKWINQRQQKSRSKSRNNKSEKKQQQQQRDKSTGGRDKSTGRDKSSGRDRSNRRQASGKRLVVNNAEADDPLVDAGLADVGEATRWSEEDMFKANERLVGRKVDYDGNPHVFAEKGFVDGIDPHAFRVVGGSLMNAPGCIGSGDDGLPWAGDDQKAKYQPLVRDDEAAGPSVLTPFFTNDGATPWGDVVQEAKTTTGGGGSVPRAVDSPIVTKQTKKKPPSTAAAVSTKEPQILVQQDGLDVLTDGEITAKRQEAYQRKQRMIKQYEEDMAFVHNWVANLPRPVEFKIQNVDAIIERHFGKV